MQLFIWVLDPILEALPATQIEAVYCPLAGEAHAAVTVLEPRTVEDPKTQIAVV